ncbi:MAG: hypothetical protein V4525_05670 [Pseudomonadota bacterium]
MMRSLQNLHNADVRQTVCFVPVQIESKKAMSRLPHNVNQKGVGAGRAAREIRAHLQQGATLLVSMIMLVLITLLVVSMFYFGKGNLQVVANMQQQQEVVSAAQSTLESAISSTLFFTNPSSVFPTPCATANTLCVDSNGDGIADITVTLTPAPACIKVQALLNSTLDLSDDDDLGCTVGVQQSFGVAGATSGNSMCANSVWEVTAVANDAVTEAQAYVTQGISVRVASDDAATSCP